MNLDTVLGNIGIFLAVISALAISIERITDILKLFLGKWLVKEQQTKTEDNAEQKKKEDKRKRFIRVIITIPVGIALAFLTDIDAFKILGLDKLLGYSLNPVFGIIISGLLASRGSAFWHDVIEIFTKIKEAKTNITEVKQNK